MGPSPLTARGPLICLAASLSETAGLVTVGRVWGRVSLNHCRKFVLVSPEPGSRDPRGNWRHPPHIKLHVSSPYEPLGSPSLLAYPMRPPTMRSKERKLFLHGGPSTWVISVKSDCGKIWEMLNSLAMLASYMWYS